MGKRRPGGDRSTRGRGGGLVSAAPGGVAGIKAK